jgi:hypothetical protein
VADEGFVEDFVDGFTVVDAPLRFAHYARALSGRKRIRHDAPHEKRGAKRLWPLI